MKKLLLFVCLLIAGAAYAQNDLTITMRPRFNFEKVDFDSIVVRNITQGTQKTFYYPDSALSNQTVGINALENDEFEVSQNYPNPFSEVSVIKVNIPKSDKYVFSLCDISGHLCLRKTFDLVSGEYTFKIECSRSGLFFLNVKGGNYGSTIKIVSRGGAGDKMNFTMENMAAKNAAEAPFFSAEDILYPVAYATINGNRVHSEFMNSLVISENGLLVLDMFGSSYQNCPSFSPAGKTMQVINKSHNFIPSYQADEKILFNVFFSDSLFYSVPTDYCYNGDTPNYEAWRYFGWYKYKMDVFPSSDGTPDKYALRICGLDENIEDEDYYPISFMFLIDECNSPILKYTTYGIDDCTVHTDYSRFINMMK